MMCMDVVFTRGTLLTQMDASVDELAVQGHREASYSGMHHEGFPPPVPQLSMSNLSACKSGPLFDMLLSPTHGEQVGATHANDCLPGLPSPQQT